MYSGESVRPTWSGIAIVHPWSSLSVCCPAGTAPAAACCPLAGGCAAFDLPDVTGRRRVALVVVLGAISPSFLMAMDACLHGRLDCQFGWAALSPYWEEMWAAIRRRGAGSGPRLRALRHPISRPQLGHRPAELDRIENRPRVHCGARHPPWLRRAIGAPCFAKRAAPAR